MGTKRSKSYKERCLTPGKYNPGCGCRYCTRKTREMKKNVKTIMHVVEAAQRIKPTEYSKAPNFTASLSVSLLRSTSRGKTSK